MTLWDPIIRFFATGGSTTSGLQVEVLASLPGGVATTLKVGTVTSHSLWAPTSAMRYVANAFAAVNGTTSVRFRFTPLGGTGWKIDDLYVDPRKGG